MVEDNDNLAISTDDVQNHVLKYGLDVFPPVEVRSESVRAQEYFNALQTHTPKLYQKLSLAPQSNEFNVFADLSCPGASTAFPTLVFASRGPVFCFPLQLLTPQGVQSFVSEEEAQTAFEQAYREFHRLFPSQQVLRLGLVRELVFATGHTNTVPWLASRFPGFPGASAGGGNATLLFTDDLCNIRITVQPMTIRKRSRHHLSGQTLEESQHGLQVLLDVNNREMREQTDQDMETTLTRARSLWPESVLDFINGETES